MNAEDETLIRSFSSANGSGVCRPEEKRIMHTTQVQSRAAGVVITSFSLS